MCSFTELAEWLGQQPGITEWTSPTWPNVPFFDQCGLAAEGLHAAGKLDLKWNLPGKSQLTGRRRSFTKERLQPATFDSVAIETTPMGPSPWMLRRPLFAEGLGCGAQR